MGATHTHHHGRALTGAAVITLLFMVVELAVGWWTQSLALMSDGLHMFLDSGGLLLSLSVFWLSQRPSSPRMSFGYARAEVLGAWMSGLVILIASLFIVAQAMVRIGSPVPIAAGPATAVAVLGLVVNLISLRFLSHGKEQNINIRAAYLHVMADLLGSLGAIVSGVVVLWTGWLAIDAWVTFGIGGLLLWNAARLLRTSILILMNSAPSDLDPVRIRSQLASVPGVASVHDLHIWEVSHGKPALSVHLISSDTLGVLPKAQNLLKNEFDIRHSTIQIDHPDHFDVDRCFDCTESKDLLNDSCRSDDHTHP